MNDQVQVTGSASLTLKVIEMADPIVAGTEADYVIQITNRDALPAYDLEVRVDCAAELQPLRVINAPQSRIEGRVVTLPSFDLAPFGTRLFRLRVRAERRGDAYLKVTLSGADLKAEQTEEISTRILGRE
ncbi:MAG: hypothetical protein NZM31_01100 [Gemmatales bacterium]|nr:hypothetical protein [Gemmatales bacterium]MDW8385592.1 hypothetical protein [Gemmatales bacterium]